MEKELKFRISSGLKDIIGKDLITDDFIAVFELVKNSYDAHATKVVITFEEDKIVIADNGKGMSKDDLMNKWLFLAYSAKKDFTEDSKFTTTENSYRDRINAKRNYAGAKGIGRFSCDKLGQKLYLTTKSLNTTECEQIIVDWTRFEKDQYEEFIDIPVKYNHLGSTSILLPNFSTYGTVLEIEKLNNTWERKKLIDLKQSLEKLINPFTDSEDFTIDIVCKRELKDDNDEKVERKKVNGTIKNSIIEILNIKTTQIDISINKEEIETKLMDRGDNIYHIKQKNIEFPLLENIRINLFYLNRAAKINFKNKMGIEPVNFGSVFLFKNGFRVQPYGNKGADNWGLDNRAMQSNGRYLGTKDLFGRIEIVTNNSAEFKEVSSREGGLVKTEGYKQLFKAFYELGIKRLERYVTGVLWGNKFFAKEYFENNETALAYRTELLETDKFKEDTTYVKTNIASKIDFVQLVKALASDKNIEVISFNTELANILQERELVRPQFIRDLEEITNKINNKELIDKVTETEIKIQHLLQQAELEKVKRINAIQKANIERRKRKKAEAETKIEKEKNTYLLNVANKRLNIRDNNLFHNIKLLAVDVNASIENITYELNQPKIDKLSIINKLFQLRFSNNNILTRTELLTNAKFKTDKQVVNVVKYISEYVMQTAKPLGIDVIITKSNSKGFEKNSNIIELSMIFVDLISNSKKALATIIYLDFTISNHLELIFSDNGKGLNPIYQNFPDKIFELGVTSTADGSGIGLFAVRDLLGGMNATIQYIENNKYKGASFKIIFE